MGVEGEELLQEPGVVEGGHQEVLVVVEGGLREVVVNELGHREPLGVEEGVLRELNHPAYR